MPRFFVENEQIENNEITIENEDVRHIKNVLRKNIGDQIEICNKENGRNFLAKIIEINDKQVKLNMIEEINETSESNIYINIFQGLPKADKMELIIQKSVELGVSEITPVAMKRCVVKINEKDEKKKIDRWQKISEGAAKQSGRNIIPKINTIKNIKNICESFSEYDIVLVAYENEKENKLKEELKKINKAKDNIKIAVVIGPEGGLEIEDVQLMNDAGAKTITLGPRILRTETVALNIISIIMYELEK